MSQPPHNPYGEEVKDRSQYFRWMITSYDVVHTPKFNETEMFYLNYQKEKCPSTDRIHWQIYLELKKKKRYNQISALLGLDSASCFKCNGTPEQCRAYVTKEDTRVESGIEYGVISRGAGAKRTLVPCADMVKERGLKRTFEEFPEDCIRHMNALKQVEAMFYKRPVYCKPMEHYRSFQQKILDMIKEDAHDRHVYWFCDKTGGSGKSKLRIELVALHNAFGCEGGKNADIIHNATEFVNRVEDNAKVFVFDFARCSSDYISYGAIESIKNGTWMSTKYQGGQVSIQPPHVLCFANDWPDLNKMSIDRWRLYEIEKVNDDYVATEKTIHKVGENSYIVV